MKYMPLLGGSLLSETEQSNRIISELENILEMYVPPRETAYRIFNNQQLLDIANKKLAEAYEKRELTRSLRDVIIDFRAMVSYINRDGPEQYDAFIQLRKSLDNCYGWLMECSKTGDGDTVARERLRLEVVKGQEAYHEIEERLYFYNVRTKLIVVFCDRLKDVFNGEYQPISMLEINESTRQITDRMWPVSKSIV
ncbi:hypothetical protein J4437_04170 [Candidatus Woesearchaeota archaeon]|nr:hypothetical protein [Candidatus Woesearchaeota archaeon]